MVIALISLVIMLLAITYFVKKPIRKPTLDLFKLFGIPRYPMEDPSKTNLRAKNWALHVTLKHPDTHKTELMIVHGSSFEELVHLRFVLHEPGVLVVIGPELPKPLEVYGTRLLPDKSKPCT